MLPVITIARQFGSGGHEVGEKVAKKLGLPFFDKELIAMAAKKSGLSEEVFADADEKATSSLLYSMVMGSYAFGALSLIHISHGGDILIRVLPNGVAGEQCLLEIHSQQPSFFKLPAGAGRGSSSGSSA